jgi:plasmid stability protein
MSSITIRNLEPEVKARLRVRAARHGISMEQEVRDILREAVARESDVPRNLAEAVRELFRPFGGVKLEILPRESMRAPPKLK